MVLLEAMESRVPIVSTDVGDAATLLDGTPSRVVPPSEPSRLAAALADTLDALDRGDDLTSAGAMIVRQHYSSAAWADELVSRYRAATE